MRYNQRIMRCFSWNGADTKITESIKKSIYAQNMRKKLIEKRKIGCLKNSIKENFTD